MLGQRNQRIRGMQQSDGEDMLIAVRPLEANSTANAPARTARSRGGLYTLPEPPLLVLMERHPDVPHAINTPEGVRPPPLCIRERLGLERGWPRVVKSLELQQSKQ